MLVYQRVFDSDSALFNFSHIHWKLLNMCPLPVGKLPWYVGVNPHPPAINQASTIYHNSITRYSITRYHQIFNIIYQPPVNFTNWDGFNGITFWVLNIKYVYDICMIYEYHWRSLFTYIIYPTYTPILIYIYIIYYINISYIYICLPPIYPNPPNPPPGSSSNFSMLWSSLRVSSPGSFSGAMRRGHHVGRMIRRCPKIETYWNAWWFWSFPY